MVATMSVYFDFGGTDANPATEQDVDALGPPRLKFKVADDATIDSNNKIPIPTSAGTNYSYWKQVYLYCDDPDSHSINNVKIYSDGANGLGTGVDLKVGLQFPAKTNASNAGYEVANTAATMVSNHSGISTVASIFNYASGTGLTVTIGEAGGVINAAGETTNYVVLQMTVDETASIGTTGTETLTFSYDEA